MKDEQAITREARLDVRIKPERYEQRKKLAGYAAVEDFIVDDYRGNVTDLSIGAFHLLRKS